MFSEFIDQFLVTKRRKKSNHTEIASFCSIQIKIDRIRLAKILYRHSTNEYNTRFYRADLS